LFEEAKQFESLLLFLASPHAALVSEVDARERIGALVLNAFHGQLIEGPLGATHKTLRYSVPRLGVHQHGIAPSAIGLFALTGGKP
jgi:hypothetical protein